MGGLVQGERRDRAGRDAGAATGAGVGVDQGVGAALRQKLKADGAGLAMILAGPALHGVEREAVGRDNGLPWPWPVGEQGAVFAGGDAFPAEGAAGGREAEHRITGGVAFDDLFGAGPGTIAALGAGFGKGDITESAGGSGRFCAVDRTSQERAS